MHEASSSGQADAPQERVHTRTGKHISLSVTIRSGEVPLVTCASVKKTETIAVRQTFELQNSRARNRFLTTVPQHLRAEAARLLHELTLEICGQIDTPSESEPASASVEVNPEEQTEELWFIRPVTVADSPADGREMLEEVYAALKRHVVVADEALIASALWVVHSYTFDTGRHSPILALISPVKRCGKSTFLYTLDALVRKPVPPTSNLTLSNLFRLLHEQQPTFLIDEADLWLTNNEMLAALNLGHRRGGIVLRGNVADKTYRPQGYRVWGPKAIAQIGGLQNDAVADRSIIIQMQRKHRGAGGIEELPLNSADDYLPLRSKIARWAQDNDAALRQAHPGIPKALNDRAADNWRPLFAIADLVGGTWPERARQAAVTLSGSADDLSNNEWLLHDLRDLFRSLEEDRITTEDMLKHLNDLEDQPWGQYNRGRPMSSHDMAALLKPFGIRPTKIRVPGKDKTARGYYVADFEDAFSRFLPPETEQTEQPEWRQETNADAVDDVPEVPPVPPVGGPGAVDSTNAGNTEQAGKHDRFQPEGSDHDLQ